MQLKSFSFALKEVYIPVRSASQMDLGLHKIRRLKYDEMVLSNRRKIEPAELPPSSRAACFHGLRVYHQVLIWAQLRERDMDLQK